MTHPKGTGGEPEEVPQVAKTNITRVPTVERAANPPQDVRRDRGGLQWGRAQLGRPEGQVLHRGRGAEGGQGEGQVGEGRTSQDA